MAKVCTYKGFPVGGGGAAWLRYAHTKASPWGGGAAWLRYAHTKASPWGGGAAWLRYAHTKASLRVLCTPATRSVRQLRL